MAGQHAEKLFWGIVMAVAGACQERNVWASRFFLQYSYECSMDVQQGRNDSPVSRGFGDNGDNNNPRSCVENALKLSSTGGKKWEDVDLLSRPCFLL